MTCGWPVGATCARHDVTHASWMTSISGHATWRLLLLQTQNIICFVDYVRADSDEWRYLACDGNVHWSVATRSLNTTSCRPSAVAAVCCSMSRQFHRVLARTSAPVLLFTQ